MSTRVYRLSLLTSSLLVALSIGGAPAPQASAQPLDPQWPLPLGPQGTPYRLSPTSFYSESSAMGARSTRDVRGTFHLLPTNAMDGNFRVYQVKQFNVLVTLNGVDTYLTGAGIYKYEDVGMLTVVPRHRMELTLQNGRTSIRLDSGLITAGTFFPRIDIPLRQVWLPTELPPPNTMPISLRLAAGTIAARELIPYNLDPSVSQYLEGCTPPCACALLLRGPATGAFALVRLGTPALAPIWPGGPTPIPAPSARQEWAVLNWNVAGYRSNTTVPLTFQGVGIYRRQRVAPSPVIQLPGMPLPGAKPAPLPMPAPTPIRPPSITPVPVPPEPVPAPLPLSQRLHASLLAIDPVAGIPPVTERWDSLWRPITLAWPAISLSVQRDPWSCYTRVFNFTARPAQ
jgi:hypothetical protein